MSTTPDTPEVTAVQIALEERRKHLTVDLPRLVQHAATAHAVADASDADVAYVQRHLTELDAALAAAAPLSTEAELLDLVRMLAGRAVVVVDAIGRPGIGYQNSNGYDRYLVPGYPTEVNASVFSYPVTVVRAATR